MAYFLGRDVDVFVTLEQKITASGVTVVTGNCEAVSTGGTFPSMNSNGLVLSGAVSDVTGVDLSIGISDEDVGPFFGQLATQKIEIRKETTVSLTRKKSDNTFDVLFNGPTKAVQFDGSDTNAARMGARFGISWAHGGSAGEQFKISQGLVNPTNVASDEGNGAADTVSCYGYRVHVRLKDDSTGEIFTVRNCAFTGHTVSLNADGTSEETLEFTAVTTPYVFTPTGTDDFYRTLTPLSEM